MKPFLFLQLRDQDTVADDELQAFLKYGGLGPHEVQKIRMEKDSLPVVDPRRHSGIIVGGGPWNVSDEATGKSHRQRMAESWLDAILKEVVQFDTPYLGVCYGLGALSKHLHATVSKEQFAESPGAIDVELTPEAKNDPLLAGLPSPFRAFVGHKESCQHLPVGAVWLARSAICPIHMYRMGKNIYATQFHPELDTQGVCLRVDVYKHLGYFPPVEAERIKEKARWETITVPMQILKRFVDRYKTEETSAKVTTPLKRL